MMTDRVFSQLAPTISGAVTEETRVKIGQEFPTFNRQPLLKLFGQVKLQDAPIGAHFHVDEVVVAIVDNIDHAGAIRP
jgi:hypothetical protein